MSPSGAGYPAVFVFRGGAGVFGRVDWRLSTERDYVVPVS